MPSGPVTWLGSQPGHVQYDSLLLGPGTPWYLAADDDALTGWDEAVATDSGTVLRSQQHGGRPGRLLSRTRVITMAMIVNSGPGRMDTALRTLEAGTDTTATAEVPLIVQLDDVPLLVWARCTRRAANPTRNRRLGFGKALLQFEATDPRRYALDEQALTTGLPTAETGLAWGNPDTSNGLAWGNPDTSNGLAWGVPGATGDVTAVNTGSADAHPVIEFRGPCTTPSLSVSGTTRVLEYGITLAAGDVLTVDCWAGTVLLSGQDRLTTATNRSVPEGAFVIPKYGVPTPLSFRSADVVANPAASCTVRWRAAYT